VTGTPRLLFHRFALVLYCPVSCILIGLLSAYIGQVSLHPQSGWPQEASRREARALRALKGRRSKAQGVSPGNVRPPKIALKGRSRLLRPFRALSSTAIVPRAHALGFAVPPLQGSVS